MTEVSQAKTGVAGEQGQNFITTAHQERKESGMRHLLNGQLLNGYTIREINHSHPTNPNPSGENTPGMETRDYGFAAQVKRTLQLRGLPIPEFNIYHVPTQTMIPYAR